jgi:polyphosphate kinase
MPVADPTADHLKAETAYALPFSVPTAVAAQPVPEGAGLDHPALYLNKELGAIDLIWRVFSMALDERLPLLERVRFTAITAGIVDELVQKRVGGLKRQQAAGVRSLSADGRTPTQQLKLVDSALRTLHRTLTTAWEETLKPALREKANVVLCEYDQLDPRQRETMHAYFQEHIYPILTPLAVDPGRPFPLISNMSLSLAIALRHPGQQKLRYARLKVPSGLKRWLPLETEAKDDRLHYLPVEQLIAHHLDDLFSGMEIIAVHPFRVTRNADLRRDEEEAEDLLAMISEELRQRRFAPVVRLEVARDMPRNVLQFLMEGLGLGQEDVYEVDGLLDLTGCSELADLDRPDLLFEPWEPVVPAPLCCDPENQSAQDIFDLIRQGDILVHHPYDSFAATVQRLIEEAAADEHVLAIKQTIYRTSHESPIVQALIRAAEKGKQVAVLVEVKARFDEANNIERGQMMEDAGVHVAYGLVGLKTHAKATLIVRKEGDMLRTYCHVGTGNYHPRTATLYADLSLLTCAPELGRDLVNLFHHLTGYAPDQPYALVLVAPRDMQDAFTRLIEREIAHQAQHGNGHIIAKMNALDDTGMIRELYRASQAGVQIDLIVRAHCCLRPGLQMYSENIRVISILGRFLEHDRVFYFHNNGQPGTYIGSADWRTRNLRDRVELVAPIKDPTLQQELIQTLHQALEDNCQAWDMGTYGRYRQRRPKEREAERRYQQILMEQALKRGNQDRQGPIPGRVR